jgi:hypothetical protein
MSSQRVFEMVEEKFEISPLGVTKTERETESE